MTCKCIRHMHAIALWSLILAFPIFAISQDTATNSAPSFSVLYSFPGGKSGASPINVVRDAAGNLYGVTGVGGDPSCGLNGTPGCGVVFKLSPAGKETVLHRFTGSQADQGDPAAAVIRDAAGNLYGTTTGAFFAGTVFKVDKTGKYSVLHVFTFNTIDGAHPRGRSNPRLSR